MALAEKSSLSEQKPEKLAIGKLPACKGQDEVMCDGGSCVYRSPCSALTSVCCVCLFLA